jgi:lipoprotein signal peptidase
MLGMGISILILYYYKIFISEVGIIATSLFLGGIISNTIDRLLINGVRDMFSFFNTSLFGIFNLADIYLTFGSLIALYIIISPYATKFFITK